MKKLKIAGIVLIVLIGIVAAAGALFVRSMARRGLPDYDVTVELSGFTGEVVVYRDAFGIPHVYAPNEDDLYRAVGYCMAQDRLWQMDLLRRVCTGRLSEIFGEDLVETDLLMRSLRMPEKSRMVLERTESILVNALQAFAEGVNQFIEAHQRKLPPEFSILGYKPEKWLPEHSLHLVGYMGWDLRLSWDEEVVLDRIRKKFGEDMAKELLPDMDFQRTLVYPEFESTLLSANKWLQRLGLVIFNASNNWAISGEKSVTGKPLLANDMHLDLNAPGIWYQMHQVVEGKLNVTGLVLPGQPFIVAGHNERIAWGFTNVMVDNTDFYLEKLNPENPNQYELNGKWKEIEVRTEEIAIKGGQTAREELRFTLRGPIISRFHDVTDGAISMRWIGNDYSDEMRTIYLLNRAKNWDEFKNAMKTFISVSQNTVYADVDGNIGLYCCAGVPIRKGGDSNAILPGWTDEFDWQGIVPFEELPHSFNPEIGFVASANNKTVSEDYPHYISRWFFPSYRNDRIREMLGEREMFSIEDFKRMHADHKSKLVEGIKGILTSDLEKSDEWSELEEQALELYSSWDGSLSKTSPEASIFETFLCLFAENMLRDEMGNELYRKFLSSQLLRDFAIRNFLSKRDSLWSDDVRTGGIKETLEEIVQKSFRDTVSTLRAELGADPTDWQWGKIHQLTLVHPLGNVKLLDWLFQFSRGPYEVGGSFHTVCPYVYLLNEPFEVTNGASHRHIYSLSNWDESLTILPTGVSGIPASPHYCDQTRLYLENHYRSDYFSKELIQKNARYQMIIKGK
ncbi:MAG: penicillin acylase family protein [Candidatus Aminicenantes bacterium]|nr:penicillin acylase family protein [Candidatus Aminicenantes bacterium]